MIMMSVAISSDASGTRTYNLPTRRSPTRSCSLSDAPRMSAGPPRRMLSMMSPCKRAARVVIRKRKSPKKNTKKITKGGGGGQWPVNTNVEVWDGCRSSQQHNCWTVHASVYRNAWLRMSRCHVRRPANWGGSSLSFEKGNYQCNFEILRWECVACLASSLLQMHSKSILVWMQSLSCAYHFNCSNTAAHFGTVTQM